MVRPYQPVKGELPWMGLSYEALYAPSAEDAIDQKEDFSFILSTRHACGTGRRGSDVCAVGYRKRAAVGVPVGSEMLKNTSVDKVSAPMLQVATARPRSEPVESATKLNPATPEGPGA